MAPTRRSFLTMAAVATTASTVAACSSPRSSNSSAAGGTDQQASGASGGDSNADLVIWADQKKADSLKEIAKSWGDKQGISVAVQIVANDLQPNFVTANQAGIDYQLTRIPDFGDIEGSQARPFLGVNCFYVASSGKNKAFAETFVADAAKDMTFAASVAGSRPPHHSGHVPAVLDQAVRTG